MTDSGSPEPQHTNMSDREAHRLAEYIIDTGLRPLPLPEEFFYASLPLCVVDAVYSIGVTYASTRNTVARLCECLRWTRSLAPDAPREQGEHTIGEFLALLADLTPDQMADDLFFNRQRTSTRSGILKAEAVRRFALTLQDAGIDDFPDLTDDRLAGAEASIRALPGQRSGISFDYFRMLAGDDGRIKPDRMVQRFIAKALATKPEQIGPDQAREVMQGAVQELNKRGHTWSPRKLDYVIWRRESIGD